MACALTLQPCTLPNYAQPQETFLDEPATSRTVPDWGKAIFSPLAVCMRPSSEEGLVGFIKYCIALMRAHLMVRAGSRRAPRLLGGGWWG